MLRIFSVLICCLLAAGQASAAVILQYHHVSDKGPAATRLSPTLFAQHLDYLAKENYRVVPLAELVQLRSKGGDLPDKTVAITFDDGYRSVYQHAVPQLKARNWPFTVFVNPNAIDKGWSDFMTWSQLRELTKQGGVIASHNLTHEHMNRRAEGETEAQWLQRLRTGIATAAERIATETGQQYPWLAYPYGEYNLQVQELMRELNLVGFSQLSGPLASYSDMTALPRFAFGGSYAALNSFIEKVSTLPLPLTAIEVTTTQAQRLNDQVLPQGVERPRLRLRLADQSLLGRVNCFATGQGAIPVIASKDGWLTIEARTALAAGRSRYNCTAPAASGRFYWYSQGFIRKQSNGNWSPEG